MFLLYYSHPSSHSKTTSPRIKTQIRLGQRRCDIQYLPTLQHKLTNLKRLEILKLRSTIRFEVDMRYPQNPHSETTTLRQVPIRHSINVELTTLRLVMRRYLLIPTLCTLFDSFPESATPPVSQRWVSKRSESYSRT